jgi:hypothetical protein
MSAEPEITFLEGQIERFRPDLDASKREFLDNLERVLGEMLQEMAELAVISKPSLTKDMGRERLGELKRRVDDHVANAPDLVERLFNSPDLWPHEKEVDWATWSLADWFNPTGAMRLPSVLANKMREAVRTLGGILADFGLTTPASLPPISASLTSAIERYNSVLERFAVVARQLAAARNSEEQKEIRDMWRNV